MSRGIFLVRGDDSLAELKEAAYAAEDVLQQLIARYPQLLAEASDGEERRWLLLQREAGLAAEEGAGDRWAVDHLLIDQDAIPTIIEIKRASDTRIRREVVGQMMDYAANGVRYWAMDQMRGAFETRLQDDGQDPDEAVRDLVGPDVEVDAFWERAGTNLRDGRVRLVFVADRIPDELRRIVEFLQEQMSPAEVIAIEVRQFVGEGLQSLVPTRVGQSVRARRRRAEKSSPILTKETFFEQLSGGEGERLAARTLLEWAETVGRVWYGKSQLVATIDKPQNYQLFSIAPIGRVYIYFATYQRRAVFESVEKRDELRLKLNEIDGVDITPDRLAAYPTIELSVLVGPGNTAAFLQVYEWFLGELK